MKFPVKRIRRAFSAEYGSVLGLVLSLLPSCIGHENSSEPITRRGAAFGSIFSTEETLQHSSKATVPLEISSQFEPVFVFYMLDPIKMPQEQGSFVLQYPFPLQVLMT